MEQRTQNLNQSTPRLAVDRAMAPMVKGRFAKNVSISDSVAVICFETLLQFLPNALLSWLVQLRRSISSLASLFHFSMNRSRSCSRNGARSRTHLLKSIDDSELVDVADESLCPLRLRVSRFFFFFLRCFFRSRARSARSSCCSNESTQGVRAWQSF